MLYFNKQFPLTQNESWTEFNVPKDQVSCVIACLGGKLHPMAPLLRRTPSARNTGTIGQNMQQPRASTHSLTSQFLPKIVTLSQEHLLLGSVQEATDEEIRSKFQASQMLLQTCPRPLSWQDNQVSSTKLSKNTNCSSSE